MMTQLTPRNAPATAAQRPASPSGTGRRYVPLLYRVAAINALLVVAAVTLTIVVLAPRKISVLALDEEVIVVLGAVALVVLANVYLLHRVVGPVQALTAFARRVDYATLGERISASEPTSEAGELALTFNEMLERLETERRESTGRVLRAQEDERLRIAQELHDQVGQELTAVLLGLSRVASRVPPCLEEEVVAVRHSASSRAELTLDCDRGRLLLAVRDHGLGLPPGNTPGTGMRGMRERATLIGGSLEIHNRTSGPGCEVRLEVPLAVNLLNAHRPA